MTWRRGGPPGPQRALASVPGVRHAAALSVTIGGSGQGPLTVVIVDPASYAAVVAGTPALQFPATALAAAARRVVPGGQVTLRSQALAAISGAPLSHGGFVTLAQGAAAAAGMLLLTLLLTLVLTARSRELTMARLVTMGLASGQWRRVVLVETLPSGIAALPGRPCSA